MAVAAGVGAILLLIGLHGVNKLVLDDGPTFSLDADWSVSSVWTIVLFATAAFLWARLASLRPEHHRVWLALAVLSGLLAVEGALQVHAWLEERAGYELNLLVVQPVLAVAVITLFVLGHRRLPSPERHLLAAAAVTLVLAQGMSMISGKLEVAHVAVVVLSVLEESFEMLTATLLVAAPLSLVLRGAPGSHGRAAASLHP